MSRVFVSYSQKDESAARKLKAALADRGNEVWLADDEIQPGETVAERVREGLRAANAVVLLIGRHPTTWARYEWSEALERAWDPSGEFRLLPVILPGAERPSFVGDEQVLTIARQSDWARVAEALEKSDTTSLRWRTSGAAQSALAERLNELEAVASALPDEPGH